ncbi:MAG: NERD domain-containing protein [Chloroflexi bacterium]|nr:MAG: NERD domain-containing protein [Chloroflexota bacterium]
MHAIDMKDHVAEELALASLVSPRRNWRRALLILGPLAILAAILAAVTELSPWPALALAALAAVAAAGVVYNEIRYAGNRTRRAQLNAGLQGQRELVRTLSVLDDDYYLVNNLGLPGRGDDVDHLVVGPNGVFALETKNYSGRIYCRDGQWYQAKTSRGGVAQPERPIRDPARQLKRNVDYLRACIKRTDPGLSRRTRLWIEGIVVFSHPRATLELPEAVRQGLPFPILRSPELAAHIRGHVPRQGLSRSDVSRLVSMFAHLRAPGD